MANISIGSASVGYMPNCAHQNAAQGRASQSAGRRAVASPMASDPNSEKYPSLSRCSPTARCPIENGSKKGGTTRDHFSSRLVPRLVSFANVVRALKPR